MQSFRAAALSVALCMCLVALVCSRAQADAVLPNGTTIPLDSSNGETQLYTFFTAQTEAIDWIKDAHTTPDTFSPLCGFTATLMLKESGSTLGVGWYNVIAGATAPPAATDIYAIVPAGSAVGTTVTGTSIRSDVRYLGGLIGFALIRTPPSFTETKWNTQCTLCTMPGPWILSVTYKSVNFPNAFYVAFEDGNTTNIGWSNDGDYNDYVFRFTGLTCAGGGEPCKVDGAQGICADGLTECDIDGALVCKALVTPQAEACDGVDNDCNGEFDEGKDLCGEGDRCVRGTCVPSCSTEFPCANEDACEDGVCVHPKCVGKTCDAGKACIAGDCVAPCDGVKCPGTQECRGGRCADPCDGVTCAEGYVCGGGVCVLDCSCGGCADGRVCGADGRCIDAGCETQTCDQGSVCVLGACADPCADAVCPRGEACVMGACQEAEFGTPGSDAGVTPQAGTGAAGTSAGSSGLDASVGEGVAGESATSTRRKSAAAGGCGCRVVQGGGPADSAATVCVLLGFGWLLRQRSRRRAR